VISSSQLLAALSRHWGYSSFRPGQEEIARRIAEGRDACVVMPTSGGKSLCYQLPAALAEKCTAVVISPLIALMQDQVAQLEEMGIPAAVWNSSLTRGQREKVHCQAETGAFRLLYLSPESVRAGSDIAVAEEAGALLFVIDEAHCISEWGHDFRPEYRLLNRLRREFPDLPIAAFTASATQRVRHDIVEQLHLRDPFKRIASFCRPNLRLLVRESTRSEQEAILLESLRSMEEGSAIVYASTIKRVEEVREFLEKGGVKAVAYHGKMGAEERRQNQQLWSADEVRVVVGTLAFGLGINKPNVRKVIHLALRKAWSSIIRKLDARDAMAMQRTVCCSGRSAIRRPSDFLSDKLRTRGKKSGLGSDSMKSGNLWTATFVVSSKSAVILANNRSGNRAEVAMSARDCRNGFRALRPRR